MMALGVDFLLYVNTGTADTPNYIKVAGQRGATLTRENETIDASSKDNAGWSDDEYGMSTWTIEGEGVIVEDDQAFRALEEAFMNRLTLLARFQTAAGNKYEGQALVTNLTLEAPYDDMATYSLTLQGKGAYTKLESEVEA